MRKIQKVMVNGVFVPFKYTPEMEQLVIDNHHAGKTIYEILEILQRTYPDIKFIKGTLKCVYERLNLRPLGIIDKKTQTYISNGVVEYFKFTPKMDTIILANYKTKSNVAICQILNTHFPKWQFNPLGIRSVLKRLGVKRTKEEIHLIIINEAKSEIGIDRYKKISDSNSTYKIGQIFFCQAALFYGRLVIKIDRRNFRPYEVYLYEKYIGRVGKSKQVVLKDPFGPIVPENLALIKHPNCNFLNKITSTLDDRFVITTLIRDKHTKEEREAFKQSPDIDILIKAKRTYIELVRVINKVKNGEQFNTTDTTNN